MFAFTYFAYWYCVFFLLRERQTMHVVWTQIQGWLLSFIFSNGVNVYVLLFNMNLWHANQTQIFKLAYKSLFYNLKSPDRNPTEPFWDVVG